MTFATFVSHLFLFSHDDFRAALVESATVTATKAAFHADQRYYPTGRDLVEPTFLSAEVLEIS
jgi:hypothetical protein